MGFMSYCRFENTTPELNACAAALERGDVLGESEESYRKRLYEAALRYIEACENYKPEWDEDKDDEF